VLTRTLERAHFAFRADASGFTAGHFTHDAHSEAQALEFTPRHWNGLQTIVGSPVTLRTQSIARGDIELDTSVYNTELVDGGVEYARASAVERFENQAEGVEQSWRFSSEPTGEGDLVVRVAVAGYSGTATTSTGLHFYTPGKLGVRYSHGVWRDASGGAWDVPIAWDGQYITVTVPEHLVQAAAYPAVLDPTVSSEAAVDMLATGNTGDYARELGVAFSGSQYLVVWRDDRNSATSDIYGTRIATDGTIVDKYGLAINRGTTTDTTPVVAWAGSRWVVAWNQNNDIAAATVTAQATIAQLGNVAATAATESLPSIAGRGSNALLVFQSNSDVRGALFSGTSFGAPFDIAVTANTEADPSVAANPAGDYLVTWSEGTTAQDIKGQLVTSAGALNGTALVISAGAGAQIEPASTWNGTNYVVTWSNVTDIYGTRVDTTGAALDTHLEGTTTVGGKIISSAAGTQHASAVSCDAASCLVVWEDRRNITTNGADIYAQRTDLTLALQGTEITVSAATRNQLAPSVAGASSGFFAAWEDQRTGGASVAMATPIDDTGAVLNTTGEVLNTGYNSERAPAYAASPSSGFLAVWADSRALGDDIMAMRYSASGSALNSTASVVSNSANEQNDPSVSYDGTQYLVVWRDNRNATDDIFASRFDATTNAALDTAGIAISTAADRQLVPDVASGANVSLVVWQDRRNGATTGFDIYGAIVTQAGTISVPDIVISNAAGDQVRPAVTFDPADNVFVVVWSDPRTGGVADIYGARVDPSGAVLDTAGVLISGAANGQFTPDVAVSGNQLLVVWDDRRNEAPGDIYGARLTAAGSLNVLDPNGIAIATTGGQSEPTVVGTQNGRWVVAWTDDRNSATNQRDIYGQDIQASGTIGTEFVISGGTEDEFAPAFQNDPSSSTKPAIVYSKVRADINTRRVYRRTLTYLGDNGNTCSMASQCSSGFCVDGYCCDTDCGGSQTAFPKDCQACSMARGAAANGTCGVVSAGILCRWYDSGTSADTYCDVTEACDGVNTTCPQDLGRHAGLACTGACGAGHCPANDATGAPHICTCP
jgi:hypothetical protein